MDKGLYLKAQSVAFTGHRTIPVPLQGEVRRRLKAAVSLAYANGNRRFLCGMAIGFDSLAAEAVLSLKEDLPNIRLVAVVPFSGQACRWSAIERKRYHQLLSQADEVVVLSVNYYPGCLLRRNDYLLEHTHQVIAYFNGQPKGGTYYTCKKAKLCGMKVENLF
ncbi:SLOG family protein [Bacteroides sp. D2]|uniref:SLOG family protein n=1 Tax=Bacteroides TaxID=816 RepID=UPI0002579D9A|nr:SLOG family protein [Bacteroides sp. D2]EFS33549.2 hypothetical protein BSGG_4249 [Bacteroides sp. D2]UWN98784.1 SLOG family protein [Bacteroides sp. D2]